MGATVSHRFAKKYRFSLPLKVRFADTDLQGHVFFANYFTYCDEAFMAFLDAVGYSWTRLENMGLELYYVESSCQFKDRAFFADTLFINTGIAHLGNSSIIAEMTIHKHNTEEVVAAGQINAVMVSKKTGKSVKIPDGFRKAIRQYENQ